MNSEFVRVLKHVVFNSRKFPDALTKLKEAHNQLFQLINEHQLPHNQELLRYCNAAYHQIKEEQQRIERWLNNLLQQDKSGFDTDDYERLDNEVEYYHGILTQIDDTLGMLDQYGNVYWNPKTRVSDSRAIEEVDREVLSEKKNRKPKPNKPRPTLEQVFSDKEQLKKLVDKLEKSDWVEIVEGKPVWKKSKVEFAAFAVHVCNDMIKTEYRFNRPTDLHNAWTTYFSHIDRGEPCSIQYFKDVDKMRQCKAHVSNFEGIIEIIKG